MKNGKIIWGIMGFGMVVMTIFIVLKSPSYAANTTGVVTATSLNVRAGAGTSYDVLATISQGTTVTILESANGWYKITCTADNKTISGYVSSTYIAQETTATASTSPTATATATPVPTMIPVYRYETSYKAIKVSAKTTKVTKVYKSAGGKQKVISKKKISLKKKKSVKIVAEKTVKGKKWFKVSFTYKKKTRTGYVKNTDVQMTLKKGAYGKITNVKKSAKIRKKAGTKSAYKIVSKKKVTLKKNTAVTIVKDLKSGSARWYKISYTYGGKTRTGYVNSKYVKLAKEKVTKKVQVAAMSDTEFEKYMTTQGFPDSYKPGLRALHKAYPYWQFVAYKTGLQWEDALAAECKLGVNLISNSKTENWKSKETGAYDATTGTWKVFDGSTWVAASKEAIAYYMDPRNFLNDRSVFQFESLEYQKNYQTKAGVETILNNTPFSGQSYSYVDLATQKTKTITYADTFIIAAQNSGVSPYHLASRVKQEVVTSATTTSSAVTGTNSTYPNIFNFYNIGATSSSNPVLNGLKWASTGTTYLRPWNDRYRSIVGGASYIGSSYINKGQNTGYLQKFNMTANSTYDHQYMTNVEAAYSEAIKTKKAYADTMNSTAILFSIPVFENMPANACAAPK